MPSNIYVLYTEKDKNYFILKKDDQEFLRMNKRTNTIDSIIKFFVDFDIIINKE